MKKIYLSVLCLASISLANAQSNLVSFPNVVKKDNHATNLKPAASTSVEKAAFWTNTFGAPSEWAMANNETSGAGTDDNWTIGTSGGAGSYALPALTSTTATDGFALFDSDNHCSGSQSGYIYNVNPIDCSGQTSVNIKFEQYFRKFNDDACFVGVSTNGTTWVDYQVNGLLAGNSSTANGLTTSVNISTEAAGQATVYIRFLYLSQGGLPSHGCDYNWMVDDVTLSAADNYDLFLSKVIWGASGTWATLPYFQVPTTQAADVTFCGITENLGLMTNSDIIFTATSAAPVYNGASTAGVLTAAQLDTFCVANMLTLPTTVSTMTVDFAVADAVNTTDADMTNNTQPSVDIAVTDYIYARDNGIQNSSYSNQSLAYEMGNVFDIFADQTLYSANITIDDQTAVGSLIYAILYSIDLGTGDFTELVRSDDYAIVSADLGSEIILPLQSPTDLAMDTPYLLVVGTDGGADFRVAVAGTSEAQTTFFKDETATWFYSTATPMVRMNFENTIGLDEMTNNFGVNVYPNPANAQTNVSFTLNNESTVVVSVSDLSGKTVYSNNLGSVKSGAHNTTVNTDSLSNGVYMVNVTANGVISTQKLVVRK